ncbi:MAG: hypothetical protein QOI02_1816, partial [Actinomycetota bacterium]|nr:hypothetical protein [Actinomycetota bacterium]
YGCYVQYLGTAAAPQHLLGDSVAHDEAVFGAIYAGIEVPEDDYRAIRRAVLDLQSFLGE